jgi:membrane protein DedA with SNARE-associated domain
MPEGAFDQLFAPIVDLIRAHIAWAGPIVFLLSFVESLAIVGALLPSTLLLLAIGSLAAAGMVSLMELSAWAIAGAGLGYWLSFEIGRYYGDRIESIGFLARRPDWLRKAHRFFERWDWFAIIASRFIPLGRAIVPLLAGAMGARRLSFHLGNWVSAALWAPLMLAPASIGVAMTDMLQSASPQFRSIMTIALVVGIVLVIRSIRRP